MDDKAKIRCPGCKTVFREKCTCLRDGVQLNCSSCNKLITLNRETDDPMIRRALKAAREFRAAQEAKIVEAAYGKEHASPGAIER